MTTTITTPPGGLEGLVAGDYITMTRLDMRKWKRFLHWITFRKPPVIVTRHQIKSVQSAATMEIGS